MHLIPTQEEVVAVLRETGALRDGHFEYPTGLHSNEYLKVPLAMRYSRHQKMMSVGLSRLLRAHPEIRAIAKDLSMVAPTTGGLPLAFGLCEALRARQVYWAEREHDRDPLRFRSSCAPNRESRWCWWMTPAYRPAAGRTESAAGVLRRQGGGLAVAVYQPNPTT